MNFENLMGDIHLARKFLLDHSEDTSLMAFIHKLQESGSPVSDRIGLVYEYMKQHYSACMSSDLIHGIAQYSAAIESANVA